MPMAKTPSVNMKTRKPRTKKNVAVPLTPPLSQSDAVATLVPEKKLLKKKLARKKSATKKPRAKKVLATSMVTPAPLPQKPLSVSIPSLSSPEKKVKTCMSSAQCFLYGGLICIVGTVILALFLSIVVLAPLGTRIENSRIETPVATNNAQSEALGDMEKTIAQGTDGSLQENNGFYGTLLSKDKGVLMVKELNPSLPLEEKTSKPAEAKTFVVRVSDKTGYTYQHPGDGKDASVPLFTPEEGAFDNLKEGMYVFVATSDDTTKTETLTASHILYSEKSPFAE